MWSDTLTPVAPTSSSSRTRSRSCARVAVAANRVRSTKTCTGRRPPDCRHAPERVSEAGRVGTASGRFRSSGLLTAGRIADRRPVL